MAEHVAISRDGLYGIQILAVDEPVYLETRIAYRVPVDVQLEPRQQATWIRLIVSCSWFQNYRPAWYDWDLPKEEALQEFAHMAVGEYLDAEGAPQLLPEDQPAADIELSEILKRTESHAPASDKEVRVYLAGLLYWADRFHHEGERVTAGDFFRLKTPSDDFSHAARRYEGVYWETMAMGYKYRPTTRLLEEVDLGLFPGFHSGPIYQVVQVLQAIRYEAPLHHFEEAVDNLRGEKPNMAAAAKEAINALESLAKIATNNPSSPLGHCIKALQKTKVLRPPLDKIFEGISAYRGQTPGVGHGGVIPPEVAPIEARFIINSSAAAILFLVEFDQYAKGTEMEAKQ